MVVCHVLGQTTLPEKFQLEAERRGWVACPNYSASSSLTFNRLEDASLLISAITETQLHAAV